jgi:hypothetical protein
MAQLATHVAATRTAGLIGGVDWTRAVHYSDPGPDFLGVMPGNSSRGAVGTSHCPRSVSPLLGRGGREDEG